MPSAAFGRQQRAPNYEMTPMDTKILNSCIASRPIQGQAEDKDDIDKAQSLRLPVRPGFLKVSCEGSGMEYNFRLNEMKHGRE